MAGTLLFPGAPQSTLDKPPSNGGAGNPAEGTSLGLECPVSFSFGMSPSVIPHPHPSRSVGSPMVFCFCFFKNMQFDFSSFV